MEYSIVKIRELGKAIAMIKAVHTGVNAHKASPNDASGFKAIMCTVESACVMLISNW